MVRLDPCLLFAWKHKTEDIRGPAQDCTLLEVWAIGVTAREFEIVSCHTWPQQLNTWPQTLPPRILADASEYDRTQSIDRGPSVWDDHGPVAIWQRARPHGNLQAPSSVHCAWSHQYIFHTFWTLQFFAMLRRFSFDMYLNARLICMALLRAIVGPGLSAVSLDEAWKQRTIWPLTEGKTMIIWHTMFEIEHVNEQLPFWKHHCSKFLASRLLSTVHHCCN